MRHFRLEHASSTHDHFLGSSCGKKLSTKRGYILTLVEKMLVYCAVLTYNYGWLIRHVHFWR